MLTIQFITYTMIQNLTGDERIKKLIEISKENKLILLEGRLRKVEEAELIKMAMSEIDDRFKGIELYVIYPENYPKNEKKTFFKKINSIFLNTVLGDRQGFTIIGPASVVKEIKNNPDNIQISMQETKRTMRK